jgi:hypothetical protein
MLAWRRCKSRYVHFPLRLMSDVVNKANTDILVQTNSERAKALWHIVRELQEKL